MTQDLLVSRRQQLFETQEKLQAELFRLVGRAARLSWSRLLSFSLFSVAAVYAAFEGSPWAVILSLLTLAFFIVLVRRHAEVEDLQRRQEGILAHLLRQLERMGGEKPAAAAVPAAAEHPYASDLALDASGRLFRKIDECATARGSARLGDWLRQSDGIGAASRRQAAVKELSSRQGELAALQAQRQGAEHRGELRLLAWLETGSAPQLPHPLVGQILSLLALVGAFSLVFNKFPWWISALLVTPAILYHSLHSYSCKELEDALGEASPGCLRRHAGFFRFAAGGFEAPLLRQLAGELAPDLAAELTGLEDEILAFAETRRNAALALAEPLLLRRPQLAARIARRHRRIGARLGPALAASADLDALAALAVFAWENPEFCWPEFVAEDRFAAEGLAHPLLHRDSRVANDLLLDSSCRLILISGSNMAGKSTFLRSVGVNAALALAGAPVCARSFSLPDLQVSCCFSSGDSLDQGLSRFAAEVRRLAQVREQALAGARCHLVLLDEILSGTNSRDRVDGAGAYLADLFDGRCLGLVTTHDLALCPVTEKIRGGARNCHFADTLVDGKMSFDYRIRPGVAGAGNALAVMRSFGLDVPSR
ncbi:MAG: mismatch repair protein MutS [Verrucomicrobiota bacterium]|jgi:hypothetical protein